MPDWLAVGTISWGDGDNGCVQPRPVSRFTCWLGIRPGVGELSSCAVGGFAFGIVGVLYFFVFLMWGFTVETHFRFCWVSATFFVIVFFRGVGVVGKREKTLGQSGSLP